MSDNEDEEENIFNVRRGQKRWRVVSDSESEDESEFQNTLVVPDGTVWQQIEEGPTVGKNKCQLKRHTPNEILFMVK